MSEDQASCETMLDDKRDTRHLYKYFTSLKKANPIAPTVQLKEKLESAPADQAHLFNKNFQSVFSNGSTLSLYEPNKHSSRYISDFD